MKFPNERGDFIVVTNDLPAPVSPAESARRRVRCGMHDVLEWLGEEVGPMPHEADHVFLELGPSGEGPVLYVSPLIAYKLAREAIDAGLVGSYEYQ